MANGKGMQFWKVTGFLMSSLMWRFSLSLYWEVRPALNKDICEAFCGEWSLTIWTLQHNWSLKNVHISMIFTYKVWIREKLFCIFVAYFFSLTWRWTSQFPLHISSLSHEGGPHKCGVHLHVREKKYATETGWIFLAHKDQY